MTVPILCLVCVCLLGWVLVLKMEIKELRGEYEDFKPAAVNNNKKKTVLKNTEVTKGMKTYEIR